MLNPSQMLQELKAIRASLFYIRIITSPPFLSPSLPVLVLSDLLQQLISQGTTSSALALEQISCNEKDGAKIYFSDSNGSNRAVNSSVKDQTKR
jgi:hypothetical protein